MADPQRDKPEQAPRTNDEARLSELRRIIEAHVADLREIIKKLRQKMN
ncbi:hypothetical protein LPJ38_09520 [Bradyrhizobium daqingense]|nr:hypothetical protein [Bradyrhizobium daqingense]UFS90941.1 hypothetical protein LPJ38_09520 [Bradyrhizobium daqingense]